MRIFFSAGEPSGDLHGANLIRELQKLDADVECVGFGGPRMAAAGGRLLFPLCSLAVVGFLRVFTHLHRFVKLLWQADRYFRKRRPDAVLLIDYPGFNWWVARRAHAHGIPVFYFVPPQIWAWAGWRINKMRRYVDHVLCTLPFEEAWYRARGVDAKYIGHPYFDELTEQQLNAAFVEQQQERVGPIVGLLPGSRDQEIDQNLPTILEAARYIHSARPDVRFLVACLQPAQAERVKARLAGCALPIEVHAERTPEIIHLSHSCIAVSGSVGLELLYRRRPTVVLYYVNRPGYYAAKFLKTCRFISLVNLLADQEVFPEFFSHQLNPLSIGGNVIGWLNDYRSYLHVREELDRVRKEVEKPGACRQAAEYLAGNLNPAPSKNEAVAVYDQAVSTGMASPLASHS
ncbi:MAG: lipid-A-disaccharide synthase [Gemmataceae bacterium]